MMETQFTPSRFANLSKRLGIIPNDHVFVKLHASYCERWRAYHNVNHIDDCLQQFDESRALADKPDDVEFAIWFHDVVYDTRASDNELMSAAEAMAVLRDGGAKQSVRDSIHELIMATMHTTPCLNSDQKLMVDIDLSILGSESGVYDRFESSIRKEYSWVPWTVYTEKRSEILNAFLARERIFSHESFVDRYEAAARDNLTRAIRDLAKRSTE